MSTMVKGVLKISKQILWVTALVVFVLTGGHSALAMMDFSGQPQYVGDYLDVSDVQRIGHALDTAPTREPVQWENPGSGYQFSLMVFNTGNNGAEVVRQFTVLAIQPSGEAEIMNLVGRSPRKNEWRIVAESPAVPVGVAARMELMETVVPHASTSSGDGFKGFMVEE